MKSKSYFKQKKKIKANIYLFFFNIKFKGCIIYRINKNN